MRRPARTLLALTLLAAALFTLLTGGVENASAQSGLTLVTNIDEANASVSLNLGNDGAQAFTTGSHSGGYVLTRLEVEFRRLNDAAAMSKLTLSVRSDQGGAPGAVLGTLTNPSPSLPFSSDSVLSFTAPGSGIDLAANTTYWVVLDVTAELSGSNGVRLTASNYDDAVTTDGWSIGDVGMFRARDSVGSWNSNSFGNSLKIGVVGFAKGTNPPLSSNIGQADGSGRDFSNDHAQEFTTGPAIAGYTLTSVDIEFAELDDADAMSKMTVVIRRSSQGGVGGGGDVLYTLTNPSSITPFTSDTVLTFTAPGSGVHLEGSTTYWLVIDVTAALTGDNSVRYTDADGEDAGGASGFSINDGSRYKGRDAADADARSWQAFHAMSMKIRLNGSVGSFIVPGDWPLKPPGLRHGDQFRLLFLTDDHWNAIPTNIARYDERVRGAIRGSSLAEIVPYADHFKVVGSTSATVTPRTHLHLRDGGSWRPDVNIYWLDDPSDADRGLLVAVDYEDFCNREGSGTNPETWWRNDRLQDFRNEDGASVATRNNMRPFTGSNNNCSGDLNRAFLGRDALIGGHREGRDQGPLQQNPTQAAKTQQRPLYGISPVFVVDERGSANDCEQRETWTTKDTCYIYRDLGDDKFARVEYYLTYAQLAPNVAPEAVFTNPSVVTRGMDITDSAIQQYRAFQDRDRIAQRDAADPLRADSNFLPAIVQGRSILEELGQSQADAEKLFTAVSILGDTQTDGDPGNYVMVNFADGALCQPQDWAAPSDHPQLAGQPYPADYFGWFWGRYPGQSAGLTKACVQVRLALNVYEADNSAAKLLNFYLKDNQNGPGSVYDPDRPFVEITAAQGATEGGDAVFTITSNPSPKADLDVSVTVAAEGDYGVSTGTQTVTIPTTGSATLTIATIDDAVDEADGSVTVTLNPGDGYTVDVNPSRKVAVHDDDAPELTEAARAALIADVRGYAAETNRGETHVNRWKRVLLALGEEVSGFTGTAMTAAEAQTYADRGWSRWDPVVEALTWIEAQPTEDTQQTPPPTPEINITAASGGTEGADATFTITANPPPTADLDVSVTVATVGDYGVTPGTQTVTIPSTGSYTLTLSTDDDEVDEADGSVTVTVNADTGYTVGSLSSETVAVLDDDEPPAQQQQQTDDDPQVRYADLIADVRGYIAEPNRTDAHRERWNRVLLAFGISENGFTGEPMTASEAATYQARWPSDANGVDRWGPVVEALTWVEAQPSEETDDTDNTPPPLPEESISRDGSGMVTEGGAATFTISASPAPAGPITVNVSVGANDFGASGASTVTVSGATASYTVTTVNDQTDEPSGSVTVTLASGSGYDLGSPSSASFPVADDDDPPVITPVVSISGGPAIAEGGSAAFTVTRDAAASSPLTVSVTVAESGDFAQAGQTGARAVTIAANAASATLSVSTENDSADEPDGSITATLSDGTDYDLGSQATATVAVSDDDAPAPPPTPVVSITGGAAVTEGGDATFTLAASPLPTESISVQVTVTGSGDYGVSTNTRTVTVGTDGAGSLTVSTTGDSTDEPDGSVTATLNDGADYDLGASKSATVSISDDDVTPEISITGGSGVTEGGDAAFTITANPVPTAALDVSVTVSQSGDYGVTTGTQTVTIPTTGSATLTVATTDDSADEADGSATATLNGGNGYTVSSSQGSATVSIADDDDAPPGNSDTLTVSVENAETVSRGEAMVFTISLSEAAQQDVTVSFSLSDNKGMIAGLDYCALPKDEETGEDYQPAADFRCEDLGLPWDHDDTVGEVTIAEGEDTATLSIWVTADAWVPGKAWIFVYLREVEGAKEIAKSFAQGQVNE